MYIIEEAAEMGKAMTIYIIKRANTTAADIRREMAAVTMSITEEAAERR
jgi:hypothetical protein